MMDKIKLAQFLDGGSILRPDQLFDGQNLRSGAGLRLAGGRPRIVLPGEEGGAPVWSLPGLLSPGFVDLQVNGGGGVLLNNEPTAEGVRAIARAHRTTGTSWILPTVITDRPEVTEAAAEAVMATFGQDGIAGIHIEGPHISVARRGTHAAALIRPLDEETLSLVARLRAAGIPTMITLAPEAVQPGQIAALIGQGVVVALGHSDASATDTARALAEGAQTFTHLFNAMSQMQNREPGVTGAAILSDAYCSVICDGIHVAPDMLRLAMRARPTPDRMIAVTDAMSTVAGPDWFELYGQRIALRDGRLVNADGALAGAHVTMLQSLAFLIGTLGVEPEAALRMCVTNPARLMGLVAPQDIEKAATGDLILVSPDFSKCHHLIAN